MKEYFEHAYEGFCNSFSSPCDFAEAIAEAAKIACVYITVPLWIIPYAIIKKKRKKEVE
jgi:hypothetical protein